MEKDVAIMMADLTGYTAMTDAHGGASAARIVHKYMELVDSALAGSATVFQRIGDQVVILADSPSDMLSTAQRLNQLTGDEHHFLSIHAGLHFGSVFIEGNNLFGSTINIAARIMNIAQRGEILCSQRFLSGLTSAAPFRSVGMHKLKNVPEPLELFLLDEPVKFPLHIDPVCHMQIDPARSTYAATLGQTTYHFCSAHCRDRFTADPEAFS
ncbi:YHS domain-containing protein [Fulvivirgaceae bacterium PWU4]|uniref:YHS domain-containing protein n=1 Tax=Chryseosolibacter histidini TaxID=2782349 RepID=A0AAP2GMX4_9BACT|nr:YHS domain-containing protein [Chryseosolibacter histidini]MBT1695887.1 YHS domain-containing protein [Chryseosolibacter histidini]